MHRLDDRQELLALSGNDPWVRWSLPDPLQAEAWVHDGIALIERPGPRRGFWVAPLRPAHESPPRAHEATRVRAALLELRDGGHLERLGSRTLSVVQEHGAAAYEIFDLRPGGDWDWMWTRTPPPTFSSEAGIVALDDARDAVELTAFARQHNPRVWTEIGTGRVRRWVGVRSGNKLVAVGGAEVEDSGAPHLAGIVTHTAHRGEGLATAVSASLTRWAIAHHGVCTLGMFSDNTVARRLYANLRYRTARAWQSRALGASAGTP